MRFYRQVLTVSGNWLDDEFESLAPGLIGKNGTGVPVFAPFPS
ncbi:MAG: hypothetical protein PF795_00805 [Kiritimatiellae bacterium]|nr:hypothetical protein [Kiritimatiellia bacterium]